MCNICMRNPCLSRCPNASQPIYIGECLVCGEKLREDYEFYTDNINNMFCSLECACDYHGIKSKEPGTEEEEW